MSPEDNSPPRLRRPATSLHSGHFRDSYVTAAQSVPTQSKTDFRFAEKVSQVMSSYLTVIAILLMVLSPLLVPVAITVAPLVTAGIRRIARAFGLSRRVPRLA